MQAGEEHGGVQACAGDAVAVGPGDAFDQVVAAEPAQVVSDLPGGDGGQAAQFGGELAQVAVGEAAGQQPEDQQRGQEGVAAGLGQGQAGDTSSAAGDYGAGEGGDLVGSGDRVVAESFKAQQAPVGGEADLPQGGQVGQPFADPEVAGVVDGGLGPQRPSFLVVLLDRGVLVVHVQARGDAAGDYPGAEAAGGGAGAGALQPPVEDQADLAGAAGVEVVADDLLEEDPSRDRLVEHLGQGKLGLQDGQVVAVAGLPVGGGERVRQPGQPFAQQRVDLLWSQLAADPLQRGGVADRGEAVVQCFERDARPWPPAAGPSGCR